MLWGGPPVDAGAAHAEVPKSHREKSGYNCNTVDEEICRGERNRAGTYLPARR
jgi:hypothetical protein